MTDPAPPPNDAPPPGTRRFPGEDDLCESCGYPIKGLAPDGDCPECGSPVDASHPKHRTESAGYCKTVLRIATKPKPTFRAMRLCGDMRRARWFLFVNSLLAATVFSVFLLGPVTVVESVARLLTHPDGLHVPSIEDAIFGWPSVLVAVPILTYIEVLGVTWFSRKRGWRVPLRHAERVACYASVGWLPGAAVLGVVMNLSQSWAIENLWAALGGNPVYGPDASWGAVFLAGVAAMLGFETLVWVGVRQVKFANTRAAAPTRPDTSENAPSSPPA